MLVREGLRQLLGATADVRVEGEAANGDEALALAKANDYDLAVLDMSMPGLSGIECRLDAPSDAALESVDRAVAITVFRVLQESLTNITRHARAKHAWVILGASGNWLQLEVEDDGHGIANADLARPRSLGLKGIRERVLYLGGSVEIGRAPRGGTRVLVRVPKLPTQAAAA